MQVIVIFKEIAGFKIPVFKPDAGGK